MASTNAHERQRTPKQISHELNFTRTPRLNNVTEVPDEEQSRQLSVDCTGQ
jgi:hypothetical protein